MSGGQADTRAVVEPQSSFIRLKKGFHPINIEYFQSGGTKELYIKTAGPETEYGFVPASMLYHDAE
ncbi:MAG: hypothetical protein VCC01_05290 [Candidatus Hydrogenedentota bacterium]